MPLQTSGTISLANIQTEFGGANPIAISEYYAGGTYVPAGTSGTNGAVPSSGQISFSKFYGTSAVVFYGVDAGSYSDENSGGGVSVTFNINSSGTITVVGSVLGTLASYTWVSPSSVTGNYWARATVTAGSLSSGTTGSWLSLGTTQSWVRSRPTVGSSTVTFTIDIATDSGGSNIIDTASITLLAIRNT